MEPTLREIAMFSLDWVMGLCRFQRITWDTGVRVSLGYSIVRCPALRCSTITVPMHSQASFPRSIALPQLPSPFTSLTKKHLAYCLLNESRFSYRGLADLTIDFTPQVHAHVGRTRCTRSRGPRGFEMESRSPRPGERGRSSRES